MNSKLLRAACAFFMLVCFSALTNAEAVWIDVRSALEHKIDNIEGDVRISHNEIVQGIGAIAPDKNTEVQLYCRSGGRADKAMAALKDAGYTNVHNAGGIEDARRQREIKE